MTHSRRVLLAIVIACLVVYNANCRLIAPGDSRPARLLPFALLNSGTLYLDRYGPPPPGSHWFSYTHDGHLISFYPVILPVVITPVFLPAAIYVSVANPVPARFDVIQELMEKAAASLVATLAVVVVWLTLRRLANGTAALLLTAAFAFGTQTWSTSSQALWQHGLGELLLALSLLLLAKFGAAPRMAFVVGALCGLAIFNRPPNAFFAAAIGLFYLLRGRGARLRFAAGAVAASLPFLAYNLRFFGKPLGGYQTLVGSSVFEHSIPEGVAAMLFSPGKGLLIYAPFLLFLVGAPLLKLGEAGRLPVVLLWLAFAAQLVLFGTMDWRAGACYGPRFQTDALPFLTLCLVPAVERLRRPISLAVFVACVGFGVWVQAVGAFYFPGAGSYTLEKEQFWKPSGAQFFRESQAKTARPEYLYRTAGWVRKLADPRPPRIAGAGPGTRFYTIDPCRAVDTRGPVGSFGGPALAVQTSRAFRLAGRCGIPHSAKAVSLNVTVSEATAAGSLTVYPVGARVPLASVVSYGPGRARSGAGIFPLGIHGELAIYSRQPSGSAQVTLDVSGYFE